MKTFNEDKEYYGFGFAIVNKVAAATIWILTALLVAGLIALAAKIL